MVNDRIELPKIIVVLGPTCAGKSRLGMTISDMLPCEIVSADSMQVYRHLDIGTAKPRVADLARVPHHMLSIINPDESLDAYNYQKLASIKIDEILRRGKTPLIVGGTGLYLRALLYGIFELDNSLIDENNLSAIKDEIARWKSKNEGKNIHDLLKEIDFESSLRIKENDVFRIERAISVFFATGKKISEFQKEHNFREKRFNPLKIGLLPERDDLYRRINSRILKMVDDGILDEAKNLLEAGYSHELKPFKTFNYRFFIEHLHSKITLNDAIHKSMLESRRFAKRQLTWFRKESDVNWFSEVDNDIFQKITSFYENTAMGQKM